MNTETAPTSSHPYTAKDLETFEDSGRLVRDLRNSRFGQSLLQEKALSVGWSSKDPTPKFEDFDEDDFRSFLLGCRMLLQKNDRLSMENIWGIAVNIPDDPEGEWLARLNRARNPYILHSWNKAPFPDQDGRIYKFEEIVKVFLYGSYAHSDEKKRAILRKWEQSPKTLVFMKQMFAMSMKLLLERAELLLEEIESALATGDFSAAGKGSVV